MLSPIIVFGAAFITAHLALIAGIEFVPAPATLSDAISPSIGAALLVARRAVNHGQFAPVATVFLQYDDVTVSILGSHSLVS